IMDAHGNAPHARVKHLLAPGGRFLMVIGNLWQLLAGRFNPAVVTGTENDKAVSAERFEQVMALAEDGAIRAVIDSTFAFADIVEAHRRVDTGHKAGSVVVTLA